VLVSLLVPLVALAIKIESPGPVFYRQDRIGQGGRVFRLYKFRTMVPHAEPHGPQWAQEDDARVTRVGRVLRRLHLDELPQALNLLRGEMSLIGPRPERPEFVSELEGVISFYRARHAVRPGITGWAQVNYRYGRSVEDALIKLQYDLYYIKHASVVLDAVIFVRTLGRVLSLRRQ
jgi:lipopolysaccharide/colanic/teichoic acid biosynthesis glycosyltransferase